jgi:hypothetical protein
VPTTFSIDQAGGSGRKKKGRDRNQFNSGMIEDFHVQKFVDQIKGSFKTKTSIQRL